MSKVPPLREIISVPAEISSAALEGRLVLFVGAGTSRLAGLPSWPELATRVLDDLRTAGLLDFSEIDQLASLDPRKQLSIATQIADDNGLSLDFESHLKGNGKGTIYDWINAIGAPCVTTNYDRLLEPQFYDLEDGSTTALPIRRIYEKSDFFSYHLDSPGTVVHLHGLASKPESLVVTTKDYLRHYDDKTVQTFLKNLFREKTIVFLGYGLEEAEILEHILRRGEARSGKTLNRFALQGFFSSQAPLYENLHVYYDRSFGVNLLGFLRDHNNYRCQEGIVERWSRTIEVRRPPLTSEAEHLISVLPDE